MGVQTTRFVTRKQAEDMFLEKELELARERYERWARVSTNEELEESIEDEYTNYEITDKEE